MKIFLEGRRPHFSPALGQYLKPGVNEVPEELGHALLQGCELTKVFRTVRLEDERPPAPVVSKKSTPKPEVKKSAAETDTKHDKK